MIRMAKYNRVRFILETLLSLEDQTFKPGECLVIYDGCRLNIRDIIALILYKPNNF
jgi:hypothetical protein